MTTQPPDDGGQTRSVCYSINDEEFSYETAWDAMDALECHGRLDVGAIYFEVDSEPVDLAEYLDADWLIEDAEQRAYDDIGECAEDAFSVSKEATAELEAALKSWAAKHLPSGYWRCVGKSREMRVTAEDIAARKEKVP